MKLFNFLPIAFCIGVQALPAALPEAAPAPAVVPESLPATFEKRGNLLAGIEKELKSLDLELTSTVDALLKKLGLSSVDSDINALLDDLVADVDSDLNKVDSEVDSLLKSLGLSGLTATIAEVEKALGISGKNTIAKLLKKLGL